MSTLEKIMASLNSRDNDTDTVARVAWSIASEPGDTTAGRLVSELGAEAALSKIMDTEDPEHDGMVIEDLRAKMRAQLTPNSVERAISTAVRFDMQLLTPDHPSWPLQLGDLTSSVPFALWARGDSSLLAGARMTSIVGARATTGYGEHMTMEIAAGLVDRGHTIVSGAAYGIDGMAHRAALASGGNTIAVLAGGVDRFYPSGHDALLARIVDSGLVVGEVPPSTAPTKWRFLQRNRLIAALGDATVVTEAGGQSGSLNVAGHALSLHRPVGAVPGPVTSAASAGTHRLIRDHQASLVTSAADVDALVTGNPRKSAPIYKRMIAQVFTPATAEEIASSDTFPAIVRTLDDAAEQGLDVRKALKEAADHTVLAALPSYTGASLHYGLLTGPLATIDTPAISKHRGSAARIPAAPHITIPVVDVAPVIGK